MATRRCKRRLVISHYKLNAAGQAAIPLDDHDVELLLRVVDSTGAGAAFAVHVGSADADGFHVDAGQAWTDDDMQLAIETTLVVTGTAGDVAELAKWEC